MLGGNESRVAAGGHPAFRGYVCRWKSAGKHYVFLAGDASHVDYGVAHASERGVDAHSGGFGYLFERHVAVESHVDHLALRCGECLHDSAHVGVYLRGHQQILYVLLGEVAAVENVTFLLVGGYGVDGRSL